MLFAIDTPLSSKFISLTYDQFIRNNTGKSVQDLTALVDKVYEGLSDEEINQKLIEEADRMEVVPDKKE